MPPSDYLGREYRADNLRGIIVDIGCNVGDFVEYSLGFPEVAQVVGYDIDSELIEKCRLRFPNDKRAIFNHRAVWSNDGRTVKGTKSLAFDPVNQGLGTLCATGKSPEYEFEVSTIALDTIIDSLGEVNFLKIDCEGSEYEILYNSKKLSKIERICGEFHTGYGNFPEKNNISRLSQYLYSSGFKVSFQSAEWSLQGNRGNFWASRR